MKNIRYLFAELRLLLAEKMILWALTLMPAGHSHTAAWAKHLAAGEAAVNELHGQECAPEGIAR